MCHHAELAQNLESKVTELKRNLGAFPRHWRRCFLQAFFDDEGHIYFNGSKRRVRGTQKDVAVLKTIKNLLAREDIKSRLDRRAQAIEISGREQLRRFQQVIGFARGIRINPQRRNGRWHQPMEKRRILQYAVNSYQTAL